MLAGSSGGCGGEDSNGSGSAAKAKTAEEATTAPAAGRPNSNAAVSPQERRDANRVRRTVNQMYGAVGRKDGRSLCGLMTKSDRNATARYTTSKNCEEGAKKLMARARNKGLPQIVGVNVAGDRATATVRFGKRAATTVPMARERGAWRIAGNTPAKPVKPEKD